MHLAENGRALVRVIRSFRAYPEGTIAGFDPQIAQDLVSKGFADFYYPTQEELDAIPKPRNLPVNGYSFVKTPTSRPAEPDFDDEEDDQEEDQEDDEPAVATTTAGSLVEIPENWREEHHMRRMKWATAIVGRPVVTDEEATSILTAEMIRREKVGQVLS